MSLSISKTRARVLSYAWSLSKHLNRFPRKKLPREKGRETQQELCPITRAASPSRFLVLKTHLTTELFSRAFLTLNSEENPEAHT